MVGHTHTDNAKDFHSKKLKLESMGITLTDSSSYKPQSNGSAEVMNLDKARLMVKLAGLPTGYGAESIKHAADLHNQTRTKVLKMRTP